MTTEITIPAAQYQDHDDCLAAACQDYLDDHDGVEAHQVAARWADDEREEIVLTVPVSPGVRAVLIEQGNGLPDVGDYVAGGGYLYRVLTIEGRIQTDDRRGNYVYGTVELADWADCAEDDQHTALCDVSDEDAP